MVGLIVDLFAGGGGASTGIERALGRSPDIAVNHDIEAVSMHAINHPSTRHFCESVWVVNPRAVTKGMPVDLLWASPDCTHHSKARGGKPVKKKIRGLAWVVAKWAAIVRPKLILLENVEEFQNWGPLVAKRCKKTGRVLKQDGAAASKGERVPLEQQYLIPDVRNRGRHFRQFVRTLRALGYAVEWRELRACDYGSPTIRKRFFLMARLDGRAIVWPEPSHGSPAHLPVRMGKRKPWRTAAEIIDWDIPCPSIFLTKEEGREIGVRRPLAVNTLRRIALGVKKYVLDTEEPYIVKRSDGASSSTLITVGYGEREGQAPRVPGLDNPLGTVVAGGTKHALVTALLTRDFGCSVGQPVTVPIPTVMPDGAGKTALVAGFMTKMKGTNIGSEAAYPLHTVAAGGFHHAVTVAHLISFLGSDLRGYSLESPLNTIMAVDRFGLVVVSVQGEPYIITDIGMRMLTPRELYRAQGFGDGYIIDVGAGGRTLTKKAQVRMCGNSVPPDPVEAMVRENFVRTRVSVPEQVQGRLLAV